ncbi:MAG: DUF2061 domain-containing protein [Pseudomonadota bacterium]
MKDAPRHPYFGSERVPREQDIPDVSPKRSIAKAISWRVVGTLDTLLLSFVILTFLAPLLGMEEASHADNAKTATFIAVTEVITKMVLYYVHEQGWARVKWDVGVDQEGRRREGVKRSGVKTATWRTIASLDTMLLALVFTGNIGTAISIGGLEVITKLVLYYVHERAWARISWGTTSTA